jgi:hypothetical protein
MMFFDWFFASTNQGARNTLWFSIVLHKKVILSGGIKLNIMSPEEERMAEKDEFTTSCR